MFTKICETVGGIIIGCLIGIVVTKILFGTMNKIEDILYNRHVRRTFKKQLEAL